MQYWLLKSEPETFSWDNLVEKKQDDWDGVRNFAARNHLKNMKLNDIALFYHSGACKQVVGTVKIIAEHYPDPTTTDERWVAVRVAPIAKLTHAVSLAAIKAEPELANTALVRIGRLSVMPLQKSEFDKIMSMAKGL